MTSIDDVQDISPRDQYTASAAQTDFDYSFPIFTQADLTIYVDGVLQVLTTDYTVAGAGQETGGTVTFVTPMTGGEVVTIYRDIAIARNTDVQQNGPWSSTNYNDELDKVFLIMQELENKIGRAIRFPLTAAITNAQAALEPLSGYLGKFLRITSAGILEAAVALDNVVALSAEVIGELSNPQTAAEVAASVTPTYYRYLPGDIQRYGATVVSTTNRTAVQASLNQYSHGGSPTFIPWGRWRCEGTVYGYYHVTNNPDFASADRLQAKVFIQGVGRIEVNHYNNSEYSGSVLQFTSGQLDIHDGHTTAARGSIMRDLVILNNDATAKTIRAYYTPSGTQWFNLFVANAGDGGQLDLQDIFNAEFMDIMAYGNGAGTGIKYDAVQAGGGNVTMVNVTSRNNAIDWDLGSAYDVARSNFIKNWTFKNCQGAGSPIHWRVRHGIGQATWENCWNEGATGVAGRGFAFSDMAGWQDAGSVNPGQLLLTGGGNYSDAATDSGFVHIEIGDDTATETTDGVGPITIQDVTLGQIGNNTIGIRVHNSTNAGPRVLSRINAHNNGGVFCALDDEVQIGPVIWENYDDSEYGYANHVTDTTGATDLRSRLSVYMDESYNIRPASESFSEKTITGGIAAVTALTHSIDTQADASSDDLDTLTGGIPGQTLILRAADSARTVVCKDGTGNLLLAGDFSLDNVEDRLYLHYDGVNYVEISRSDNGA